MPHLTYQMVTLCHFYNGHLVLLPRMLSLNTWIACENAWVMARAYALAVAELLDPTGELFGQRIISKGDDGSVLTNQSKRLMQVHPPPSTLSWFLRMAASSYSPLQVQGEEPAACMLPSGG
jgi:hypothetical protein